METIAEARNYLDQHCVKGVPCPCCEQTVKLYKRPLNATMARGLIWIVRSAGPTMGWVNLPKTGPRWLVKAGGEFAKLAHWSLIEALPHDVKEDSSKSHSGVWRPTAKGRMFVYDLMTVPRRVWLYNNTVKGWDEEHTTIRAALGKRFDFLELMEARFDEPVWVD